MSIALKSNGESQPYARNTNAAEEVTLKPPRILSPRGKGMTKKADHTLASTSATDLSASWRSDMRELVADYIDASEKLLKGALAFQDRLTNWAKDTPWSSLFNAQRAMASQWIEGVSSVARKLWQIEEEAAERANKAITQFSKGEV